MKKVSVYFTDPQSGALDAMAAQAGITFAEALRRALDEWLAFKEGSPMTTPTAPVQTSNVYVIAIEDGERVPLTFRNACAIHDDYNHLLTIYRRKKDGTLGRTLAQFSGADISSWYDDAQDDDEDE